MSGMGLETSICVEGSRKMLNRRRDGDSIHFHARRRVLLGARLDFGWDSLDAGISSCCARFSQVVPGLAWHKARVVARRVGGRWTLRPIVR
jgi:hypothetical protein